MAFLWQPDYTFAQASYDLRRLRRKGWGDDDLTVTPNVLAVGFGAGLGVLLKPPLAAMTSLRPMVFYNQ